jgi:hypothetical protein
VPDKINLQAHCEGVRETLVKLYEQSKSATHPVVQGTLREGFVRQVLGGFLGRSISWSSGQIVGTAPSNNVSGQMDLLLHSDLLPQVYMFDGSLCLVPGGALVAAIEVKSDLTTAVNVKGTLDQALDSLTEAIDVCGTPADQKGPAFAIAAFRSGVMRTTITNKIATFFTNRNLPYDQYWPDGVIVLSGAKKHPRGFGLFRERFYAGTGESVRVTGLTTDLWAVPGGDEALAALVALLSKRRLARAATVGAFDFGSYIFRPPARAAPAMATPAAAPGNTAKKASVSKNIVPVPATKALTKKT